MKNSNPVRKGSIPMVLIVIICLGIVAGAALFSTGNSARLDKKSELNQAAWIIAQAAVEETIVKASNGKAAALDGTRQTFPAEVTFATIGTADAKIAPVEVVTRVIEDKGATPNLEAEKEIMQLAALVPGFFKKDNPGVAVNGGLTGATPPAIRGDLANAEIGGGGAPTGVGTDVEMFYDITWRKKMLTAPAGTFDPILLKAIKEAIRLKADGATPTQTGEQFAESSLTNTEAKKYYNEAVKQGKVKENDNSNNPAHTPALAEFKKLPTLKYLGLTGSGYSTFTDLSTTPMHLQGELDAWKTTYQVATEKLADHMQSRINGCNGDFNYAIGGMLTGLGRGAPAENDSEPGEESYRDSSEASGLTEYKEALLTVSTKVNFVRGTMSAEQQYTAHRIARQMNLNKIMGIVGKSTLAYLHGYYNLTRADLIYLGFMGNSNKPVGQPAKTDAQLLADPLFVPAAQGGAFATMDERYNVMSGNLQVRNAQLANCLGAPK